MLKYISTILFSKNPNLLPLKVSLILCIILTIYILWKISVPPYKLKQEGFTQKEQFVLKQNQNIYDNFYAEVYDGLNNTQTRGEKELFQIIKMTEPTTANSVFLDVGSGTGYLVKFLDEAGYNVYGIEKSQAMIDYTKKHYPDLEIKNGDVLDPMSFDRLSFTHVLCTNMTLYQFQDKLTFFRNCFSWIMPNGYFIIHIVDPDKFNLVGNQVKQSFPLPFVSTKKRTTDAMVEYYDFRYTASYRFPKHVNNTSVPEIIFKETFTDSNTLHVRQNEQSLYMESIDTILGYAVRAGFLFHAKINMGDIVGDENQFLYTFERPM